MKTTAFICKLSALSVVLGIGSGCAIKIYMVDRQTVLEDEAAGEWPEFEKEILRKSEASSPTPFPQVAQNSRKTRTFNVLNGELASTNQSPAKKEGKAGK